VVYFGAVLAAYLLLCDEKKHPDVFIVRGVLWMYGHLWQLWKLFTAPRWVIFRRVGLVAKTQRTLLRVTGLIGMPSLKAAMTEFGFDELQRLIALTRQVRKQTRALHIKSKTAYYPVRVVIAVRVYLLSEKTVPALIMVERIYLSAAIPMGEVQALFAQMLRDMGRRGRGN